MPGAGYDPDESVSAKDPYADGYADGVRECRETWSAKVAELTAEVERLKGEREMLTMERDAMAMLSSESPRFSNPLHVYKAKQVRDRVLAEIANPASD